MIFCVNIRTVQTVQYYLAATLLSSVGIKADRRKYQAFGVPMADNKTDEVSLIYPQLQ